MFFGIATKESGTTSPLATIGDIHQPKRSAQALSGGFGGDEQMAKGQGSFGQSLLWCPTVPEYSTLVKEVLNNFYKHLVGLGLLWSLKKSTLLTLAPKQLDFFKVLNKAMQKVRCLPLLLLAWHGVFALKLASTSFQHVKLTMKLFHGTNTSFTMLSLVED